MTEHLDAIERFCSVLRVSVAGADLGDETGIANTMAEVRCCLDGVEARTRLVREECNDAK